MKIDNHWDLIGFLSVGKGWKGIVKTTGVCRVVSHFSSSKSKGDVARSCGKILRYLILLMKF
jgi:hypothetical protein